MEDGLKLSMSHFLATVAQCRTSTPEALVEEGYPIRVIYAKAEKAARKGYTEYGVAPHRPWLTPAGKAFLED